METGHRLESAERGELSGIVARAAAALQVSPQTLRRYLARYAGYKPERKPRSDKGVTSIDESTAHTAAGLLLKSTRATGKQLLSFQAAREILQYNGIGKCRSGNRRDHHAQCLHPGSRPARVWLSPGSAPGGQTGTAYAQSAP